MGKDRTDRIHGVMIWNALISLTNVAGQRGTHHSEDNEYGLVHPDVFSEGVDCAERDAVDPHPHRQDGEKCCEL